MSRITRAKRRANARRRAAAATEVSEAGRADTKRRGKRVHSEIAVYIDRFPRPAPGMLALTLAGVLIGNGYLLWLVWHGRTPLTGLVLLVLVEGVLLSLLGAAQRSSVPAGHRMKTGYEHYGLPDKAISWAGFVVGVGGAYVLWAVVLEDTDVLLAFPTSLDPWFAAGLHIAFGITLLSGVAGLVADHLHLSSRRSAARVLRRSGGDHAPGDLRLRRRGHRDSGWLPAPSPSGCSRA